MSEELNGTAAEVRAVARDSKDLRGDMLTAQLLNTFETLQNNMLQHMEKEGTVIKEMSNSIAELTIKADRFLLAFPDGDPRAHCEYHELLIAAARDKREFWKRMRFHLVEVGLFSFLAWALYALWKAFLMGPR